MELAGSIALVTGGSRGIGKNVVQSVTERGAGVILTYQSSEADAEALVAEVEGMVRRAAALQLDLDVAGTFGGFADRVEEVLGKWDAGRFQLPSRRSSTRSWTSV